MVGYWSTPKALYKPSLGPIYKDDYRRELRTGEYDLLASVLFGV